MVTEHDVYCIRTTRVARFCTFIIYSASARKIMLSFCALYVHDNDKGPQHVQANQSREDNNAHVPGTGATRARHLAQVMYAVFPYLLQLCI